jgi:serine/threonine protein kinase
MQGQTLQGRYYIEGEMKKGGGGTIYCASHYSNRSYYYAIKENSHSDIESRKQFINEAGLLMKLNNSNLLLPKAIEYFEENGRQYLVMQFVPGTNLDEILKKKKMPFIESEALHYIDQICSTLEYLHSHNPPIIHRDIKPQNIIIDPIDKKAYLVDFGISKIHSGEQTIIGGRGYTPGFSPPEQYSNKGTNHRSDIYALGATLYNLLTNNILPEPQSIKKHLSPRKFNSQISPHVEQAILKAIALKPEHRFERVSNMKNALHTPLPFWQQPVLIRSFGVTITLLALMSIIGVLIFTPGYSPTSSPTVTIVSVTLMTSIPTPSPTVALPSPTSLASQTLVPTTVEPITTKITTSTPLPQPTSLPNTSTPEPAKIEVSPTPAKTILPTNTPKHIIEDVEIPVDKSAMTFENLSGSDLVIDIIGPTSIDALAIPPNNKKVVAIEPGTYTFNAHAPNGTVSLSADNFDTNVNQWIEVIIFTTAYQQSIKDW